MDDNARLNPQAIDCEDVAALPAGLHKLMLGDKLNAVIYIPSAAGRGRKISLLCLLHGAFGKDGIASLCSHRKLWARPGTFCAVVTGRMLAVSNIYWDGWCSVIPSIWSG